MLESLTFLGEGDFCTAYLLNGERVVRVPRHDGATRALHREACLLGVLGPRLSLPVPRPKLVECPDEPGLYIAIHDAIPGEALVPELWSSFPASPRVGIARALGSFLREVHGLDPSTGRSCGLSVMDHRAGLKSLIARLRSTSEGSSLPRELRRGLHTAFDEAISDPSWWEYRAAILHGDLSPGHVLVDTRSMRIEGIIDWGDAMVGDPARDFIFLYEDWGSDFLDLALEGYEPDPGERQALRSRILLRYLADQLEWILDVVAGGRATAVPQGVEALHRALGDFQAGLR